MKVTIDKSVLAAALRRCVDALPRAGDRSGGFVRMVMASGSLTLTGYDGDLMVSVCVDDLDGDDGECAFPGRLGSQVLRSLGSGNVDLWSEDASVHVKMGSAKLEFATPPMDSMLVAPVIGGEPQELDAASFCQAADQVVYAASTDQARPLLTGVLLQVLDDGLRLAATDSYRLAMCDVPGHTLAIDSDAILPARALVEVGRCYGDVDGPLTIRISEGMVSFSANGTVVGTRLIEGQYPDYLRLVPLDPEMTFTADVASCVDVLERIQLVRGDASDPAVIVFGDGGATVTMTVAARGMVTETLGGAWTGDPLTVGCNPKFLADAINHADATQIALEFADAMKPTIVRPGGDSRYCALVMPMRIS